MWITEIKALTVLRLTTIKCHGLYSQMEWQMSSQDKVDGVVGLEMAELLDEDQMNIGKKCKTGFF